MKYLIGQIFLRYQDSEKQKNIKEVEVCIIDGLRFQSSGKAIDAARNGGLKDFVISGFTKEDDIWNKNGVEFHKEGRVDEYREEAKINKNKSLVLKNKRQKSWEDLPLEVTLFSDKEITIKATKKISGNYGPDNTPKHKEHAYQANIETPVLNWHKGLSNYYNKPWAKEKYTLLRKKFAHAISSSLHPSLYKNSYRSYGFDFKESDSRYEYYVNVLETAFNKFTELMDAADKVYNMRGDD